VKKPTGGFDNGLGAILIGEHSLASFLSKKSSEGISGLFQQHRSFEVDGHRIFFKIDYLDQAVTCHSPDPADPSVTKRVITIMLVEEY